MVYTYVPDRQLVSVFTPCLSNQSSSDSLLFVYKHQIGPRLLGAECDAHHADTDLLTLLFRWIFFTQNIFCWTKYTQMATIVLCLCLCVCVCDNTHTKNMTTKRADAKACIVAAGGAHAALHQRGWEWARRLNRLTSEWRETKSW